MRYVVKSGDTLSAIARDHGYASWRDIYYHDSNEEFRRKRPNPDLIYPGDELNLPDRESPVEPPPETPPETPPAVPPATVNPGGYNLFWMHPIPGDLVVTPMARRSQNTIDTAAGIDALIVYPAFLTPAIVVADQHVELLVLTKGQTLLITQVNRQLKISPGLDSRKIFNTAPLFSDLNSDPIRVTEISLNNGEFIKTPTSFVGNIDARAMTLFSDKGYTKLFQVSLDHRCLLNASGSSRNFNTQTEGKWNGRTHYDEIIREVLDAMNGVSIPERGRYAFRISGDDVSPGQVSLDDPIQAYHPVFYHRSMNYTDIAHISDIHISARHQILAQSPARVIEYEVAGAESDLDVSPPIGTMLNRSSRNVKRILDRVGAATANALFVGGDIIDFIPNVSVPHQQQRRVREVWNAVALDDNYRHRYQNFIDFVSFYSLILDFCRRFQKPAFALTGNHDCYNDAYGISPRVLGVRANEGIAADHNLTLYEAILAFGRTYDELKSQSMFTPAMFNWFYAVLTPFADFAIKLPHQVLVGMAWGEEEDLLDVPLTNHGFGHLPRSDNAISARQLRVLEDAVNTGKKVILSSHFTFASYIEHIPMSSTEEGDIEFETTGEYGDHDMGTFETNRKRLYEQLIGLQRKIQCIVTGHSHRRGIYFIRDVDYTFDNSVKTWYYDFGSLPGLQQTLETQGRQQLLEPIIIVSDSGGPVPRYNWNGEFNGWGSSPPGGTLVNFAGNGAVSTVQTLSSGVKPRFVVALDYLDLIAEQTVLETVQSDDFSARDEARGRVRAYRFQVDFSDAVASLRLRVRGMRMYLHNQGWAKVEFSWNVSAARWELTGNNARNFRRFFRGYRGREMFLAIQLTSDIGWVDQWYEINQGGWWTFECEVERQPVSSIPIIGPLVTNTYRYSIFRIFRQPGGDHTDRGPSEFPDFAIRETLPKYT
ncbi:hypothetical protein DSCO28_11130 [Desulfosarcina ovata subsp. sediminis]|uniref:LysM domain-containing protein n=1 Tax=Desulfosarcina ovata subsp. sediminis TaxID=885957 RepID=A0A5K7ZKN4_9BACT|nr:LysM domain-containing protein [Desulfosarcina ovata]BBO80547.1 hypothetical protein DSCO28_11130 [Desulfosarcina ovata subsp. sediminis]